MRQTRARAAGKRGFTLIELLVVVAIIALLISILLPSLARARELSKRSVCAANQKGIGTGFHTYASSNSDAWPIPAAVGASADGVTAVAYQNAIGTLRGTAANANAGETFDTNKTVSVTRAFWSLVRTGASSPKSFVCPSNGEDAPAIDDNPQNFWDFGVGDNTTDAVITNPPGYNQCSYGYQVPFGKAAKPSPNPADPGVAMVADKGPYGAVIEGNKTSPAVTVWPTTPNSTSSPDDWRRYNSPNHGGFGDGEGQNAMYADAHVEFSMTPLAGAGKDNIYTRWSSATPTDAITQVYQGYQPVAAAIGAQPSAFSATDSLIYP